MSPFYYFHPKCFIFSLGGFFFSFHFVFGKTYYMDLKTSPAVNVTVVVAAAVVVIAMANGVVGR